jgi:hypothetical protein
MAAACRLQPFRPASMNSAIKAAAISNVGCYAAAPIVMTKRLR